MEIVYRKIYVIDYENKKILKRDIPAEFNDYIVQLFAYINNNKSVRMFKTQAHRTEVVGNILEILKCGVDLKDNVDVYFDDIAQRLLRCEIETQAYITRMGINIKKGSLVQALIQDETSGDYSYLLAKVEHTNFVDDNDFTFKTGFSSEQDKIWKTTLFDLVIDDGNFFIDEVKVHLDTSAKYWHKDFLELEELLNDERNTVLAFKSIESVLLRSVKVIAPSDYTVLRNNTIGWLRREQQIDYDEMIESIFGKYHPEELESTHLEKIKRRLLQLPDDKKFDRQFDAVPKAISAKIKKLYRVNQGIDIKISDFIGEIKDVIKSHEDSEGIRYISIRTNNEATYNLFK